LEQMMEVQTVTHLHEHTHIHAHTHTHTHTDDGGTDSHGLVDGRSREKCALVDRGSKSPRPRFKSRSLLSGAVCCSVLQCVAVCCSVLQRQQVPKASLRI